MSAHYRECWQVLSSDICRAENERNRHYLIGKRLARDGEKTKADRYFKLALTYADVSDNITEQRQLCYQMI